VLGLQPCSMMPGSLSLSIFFLYNLSTIESGYWGPLVLLCGSLFLSLVLSVCFIYLGAPMLDAYIFTIVMFLYELIPWHHKITFVSCDGF
jgi:hypothetical protein